MSTYRPLSRWAFPILFTCLAATVACSSSTDSNSNSNTAGATSGGNANASAGSSGSSVAGAVNAGGGGAGAASAGASQGGGGTSAQAGAPAGGTTSAGAAGSSGSGSATGGTSGGTGASGAAGTSNGGSGGASTGGLTLTSPGWTAMPACSASNKAACPVFPKENIGTSIGGGNKSPELDWTAGPSGTQSYAIVLQDLTNMTGTPAKPFVHWVIWNIPGATLMLPAGLDTAAMPAVPQGSSQRSFGTGYQGSGKCGNVYEFVLYALPMASFTPTGTNQTAVRDGLVATNAPTATLRARSGAPGCTE